eukprot:gene4208-12858_t
MANAITCSIYAMMQRLAPEWAMQRLALEWAMQWAAYEVPNCGADVGLVVGRPPMHSHSISKGSPP